MTTLNILKENCDPKKDNNSTLPYNAYLVQYKIGDKEETRWDLTMAYKMSEIFDHYYDKYKNVLAIVQSDGKVAPKLWRNPEEVKQQPKVKRKNDCRIREVISNRYVGNLLQKVRGTYCMEDIEIPKK